MTVRLHHLPRRRTDVQLLDETDHSVLIDPDAKRYVLNPTARAIWEMCDGTTTVDELADAICEVFDVDRQQATSDVAATVEQLTHAGLLDAPKTT